MTVPANASLDARLYDSRPILLKAMAVAGVVALGFGGWSFGMELSSAVLAPGRLVVEGNVKRVQSAVTGPIAEIAVQEGTHVEAGAVLLRLEDAAARSALNIVRVQLVEALAQRRRLLAEREDQTAIVWPDGFANFHPEALRITAEEDRLFQLRRTVHVALKDRLAERARQVGNEIEAIQSQLSAKKREIALVRKERDLVAELERRQLTTVTRAIAIDRDLARFDGDEGAARAQLARAKSQLQDVALQVIGLDSNRIMDAQKEMRTLDARIDEWTERQRAAEQQVELSIVRAPMAGVVHELAVFGKGAVVRPGETLLSIVPKAQILVTEVRLRPQDIDQVRAGQPARLRFTAFNKQTTPEAHGLVDRVAADLQRDPVTGQFHYTATVRVSDEQVQRLRSLTLQAGMPVEAHIRTGERTLASYLLKPLSDHMQRALRED